MSVNWVKAVDTCLVNCLKINYTVILIYSCTEITEDHEITENAEVNNSST